MRLPLRNGSTSPADVGQPRPADCRNRSNAAQICGSHRTSALDDLIAEPQQALVGAGSCFVGVGSVWHLIAAALLLFPRSESQGRLFCIRPVKEESADLQVGLVLLVEAVAQTKPVIRI